MESYKAVRLLCTIVILLDVGLLNGTPLNIGAFNVRVLGIRKMKNEAVVNTLVKIIRRYDIVLIQEIRDKSETAFPNLVRRVNESTSSYQYKISSRTGRTRSKEQYGFIYRTDKVEVVNTYQYPDTQDVFEREPYVVQFRRKTAEEVLRNIHLVNTYMTPYTGQTPFCAGIQRNFSCIAIHTKPSAAIRELNALDDVSRDVATLFGEDILIAGDFNADCRYVCKRCWKRVDMRIDLSFTWLIGNDADTTVKRNTDCAYDRLVVTGSKMTTNSNVGEVFDFEDAFSLTKKQAKAVSDHYPVEFQLD